MRASLYKMNVLDTYALVEIKLGNPKFCQLLNQTFVITDLTMAEFYIVIYKEEGEEEAKEWHKKLSFYCRPINRNLLIKTLKYREDNKKDKLSIFDAVGYIYSRENNYKFVTGDKAFKFKEGVEFIQK